MLKVTTVLPPGHPSSEALVFFKERVEALSNGQIEVKVFLSGELGSAVEAVKLCSQGDIDIVHCATSYITRFCPIFKVLEMPFIFRDSKHQYTVLDGPTGSHLKNEFATLDLKPIAFFHAGSRSIMTKEGPITTPEQLAEKKIRVMPSPILISSILAIGAKSIPMSQDKVYDALQAGELDGWDNNQPTALNFRMYETGCIHYTRTSHMSIPDIVLINQHAFDDLNPDMKTVIKQAAHEAQAKQRELWAIDETAAEEKLIAAGMVFTDVNLLPFQMLVQDVYKDMYNRYGEQFETLCKAIHKTE